MKEIYLLYCIGNDVAFNSQFKALCKVAFKEDPLKTNKYKNEINAFLAECRNPKYISSVEEGTEELKTVKLEVI